MTTDTERKGKLCMSLFTYIASDSPLPVVENPHEKLLSVNEALALGLTDIPENLLADGFDRDEPDVILWSDRVVRIDTEQNVYSDGDLADDFALCPTDRMNGFYLFTEKKYTVTLDWPRYIVPRAEMLIAYLQKAAEQSGEVEVWHLWMDDAEKPIVRTKTVTIDEVTPALIKEYTERRDFEEEYGIPVHYRLVIKRER